jgi:tetratricopeptide (TPR) repeat protein
MVSNEGRRCGKEGRLVEYQESQLARVCAMAMKYCGQCGEPAPAADAFCTSCGRQLRATAAAPSPGDPVDRREAAGHGDDGIAFRHAVALLAGGDAKAAVYALERLTAEQPAWAVARAYLGIAYLRLARAGDARQQLEEAVRLAPESFICRAKYGEFLARLGFFDQAFQQLDLALALPPPDGESRHAAMELRQYSKDHAKGIYYRKTGYPRFGGLARIFRPGRAITISGGH